MDLLSMLYTSQGKKMLGDLTGLRGTPAYKAMPYLDQINPLAEQSYNPYMQEGRQAGQQLQQQYSGMMQDPTEFLNRLMEGYKPSQGYNRQSQQMLKAARNSAASAGMAGTENDQTQQAELIRALMGEDMQRYLNNVTGLQNQGTQGMQSIYNTGYDANKSYADMIGTNYGQQAGLTFSGDAFKRQQKSNLLNAIMSSGAKAAGAFAG